MVKPASPERTVLPWRSLQLAPVHRLLHIDACPGEPLQMFFPSLGVNEMEGFIPPVEAIFEERAKHPVLLVDAVEECANVTLPAEIASGELHGMTLVCHISPHMHTSEAPTQHSTALLLRVVQIGVRNS